MTRHEYGHLLTERTGIQRILNGLSQERLISHHNYSARLAEINEKINQMSGALIEPVRTRLTYQGRPVVNSYGISANFGMAATRSYTKAVAAVAASLDRYSPLSARGRLPGHIENQILITGVAQGSFGFEIEEAISDQLSISEESPVAAALKQTQDFLQGTVGTDDELTEVVFANDQRMITNLRVFLDLLSRNEAICSLETNGKEFHFEDIRRVRYGLNRLSQENVHKKMKILVGEFQGMLPKFGTFQFILENSGHIIIGKLGSEISDSTAINQNLHKKVTIQTIETRIGTGRPRYVLNELPQWQG